jgi:hypothetical protein
MEIRRAIRRMKNSGLEKFVKDHNFNTFRRDEPWQQAIYDKAMAYVAEGLGAGKWFYAGGQPGSGKTHICTAIAREALYRYPLVYMMWENESKALKALVTDAAEYASAVSRYKGARVLYIDDLFKPTKDGYGNEIKLYPKDLVFMTMSQTLDMINILSPTGALYENEKRVALGLRPLPELEGKRFMSLNWIDANNADQYQVGKINVDVVDEEKTESISEE